MPTKTTKKIVTKPKRKWFFQKKLKIVNVSTPKTEFQLLADAFIYLAHHQDFRSSMLTLADSCNKQADSYRMIGQGLNRLADIFEKVRWNDPEAKK